MSDPRDDNKDAIEQLDLDQRYIDRQELGQGGMGKVFVALDQMLDKRVAIKLLHGDVDSRAVVRFQQEAKVLSKLSHKYIVKIMDFYYSKNGQLFLVMEYIEGSSLESELEEKERLAPEEALRIAIQLSQALSHAHSQGIVHRDLKPANVMIDTQRNAKILDFGIAKLISGSEIFGTLTKAGQLIGSPMYMSPEQLRGEIANEVSDVYGLGLLIYTMIAGKPPFDDSNLMKSLQQRIELSPPSLRPYVANEEFCAGLDAIIQRSLNPDSKSRYAKMDEFEEQLLALEAAIAQAPEIVTTGLNQKVAVKLTKRQFVFGTVFLALLVFGISISLNIISQAGKKPVATVRDTAPIEIIPGKQSKVFPVERSANPEKNPRNQPIEGFTPDKLLGAFWRTPDPVTTDDLARLKNSVVTNLTFDGNESFKPSMLSLLPAEQIQGLILSKVKLQDNDLKELQRFKKLAWLSLANTQITDGGIELLLPLKGLHRLNLQGCEGITNRVIPLLKQFPHLEYLHLSSTNVTRDGVLQLKEHKFLRLGLSGLDLTDDDVIAFKKVHRLNLSGCKKITDKTLFHFAKKKVLKEIDISRCPLVTFEGIQACKMAGKEVLWAPPEKPANTDKQQEILDLFGMPDKQ